MRRGCCSWLPLFHGRNGLSNAGPLRHPRRVTSDFFFLFDLVDVVFQRFVSFGFVGISRSDFRSFCRFF